VFAVGTFLALLAIISFGVITACAQMPVNGNAFQWDWGDPWQLDYYYCDGTMYPDGSFDLRLNHFQWDFTPTPTALQPLRKGWTYEPLISPQEKPSTSLTIVLEDGRKISIWGLDKPET
jgi:hypothetical protein